MTRSDFLSLVEVAEMTDAMTDPPPPHPPIVERSSLNYHNRNRTKLNQIIFHYLVGKLGVFYFFKNA
jgi:hypothetical protein